MKLTTTIGSLIAIMLVVSGVGESHANEGRQGAQRALASISSVLGAQAAGMGGAFVAVANDGSAFYWNPAGLAVQRRARLYGSLGGASHNLDTLNELLDVTDILKEEDALSLEEFNLIRNVALRADGSVIRGEAGAIGTIGLNKTAFGYWAMAGGDAALSHEQLATLRELSPGGESVAWGADGIGQAGLGIAHGWSVSERLDVGLTGRLAFLSVAAADGESTATAGPEPTLTLENVYDLDTDSSYTLDAGAIFRAGAHSRFGLVGRNLTTPSFKLSLQRPAGMTRIEHSIQPSFDVGYSYTAGDGGVFAFDVHNLTEANSVGAQVSAGVSTPLADWLDVRFGYGRGAPTIGLGLDVGRVALDVASALDWEDRVAVSGSLSF